MKKSIWFAAFLLLIFASPAMAQETPKVEIFGGYSFLRVTTDDNPGVLPQTNGSSLDSVSANGFMVSGAYNLKNYLGIVGEFSRHTKATNLANLLNLPVTTGAPDIRVTARANTFLFGPRFTLRTESIEPFGHVLVGGSNGSFDIRGGGISQSDSGTTLTFAAGGGLDIKFNRRIVVRLVQADYLRTFISGDDLNSARISTGIVYRIGER
jgi:opacity protein-like surface antigen